MGGPFSRLHELHQRAGVRPRAGLGHDDGADRLAPFGVRNADHRDHRDIGMGREHILHLTRKDVEAAGDDHVLLAVEDEHVAALVLARDVAGVQPAVLQGLGRHVRPLPVFLHHMRRAHADFARLAGGDLPILVVEDADLAGRDRHAAGFEQLRPRRVVIALGQDRDRIAFGLSVQLRENRADALDALDQPRRRHRRGAVEQIVERRQVGASQLRMIQQHIDHRRHEHREIDFFARDGGEHGLRIKTLEHMHRAALEERRQHLRARDMADRRDGEIARRIGNFEIG